MKVDVNVTKSGLIIGGDCNLKLDRRNELNFGDYLTALCYKRIARTAIYWAMRGGFSVTALQIQDALKIMEKQ